MKSVDQVLASARQRIEAKANRVAEIEEVTNYKVVDVQNTTFSTEYVIDCPQADMNKMRELTKKLQSFYGLLVISVFPSRYNGNVCLVLLLKNIRTV